jgi:death-on-curing protein
MKLPTMEQVKSIHADMIVLTGGATGLRDAGMLESALAVPFQTFDGVPLYPSIQQKAARMCHSLIQNHPFVDGNKRTGIHIMLIFLASNGIELAYSQQELITFGLGVAGGNVSYEAILQWIVSHQN